ncbi:PAS domain-containing protein [Methanoplanus sp. FWC-SCC4]|uniref:PAS domain-containing protein n=1 Tax=Methanochimaera problematica TaxID=2609417 RepID=A0AA97FBB1_9EURY|nr:PAS domain-containing protein [Methanoplanus sp. FWC-SCC4]WOF15922.1 PAS domain-containing protein [Methanoplanus sp. FWC-SCC4]
MPKDQKEFIKIIEILKDNPRGMSVKQISEAIGVNRISVGHYLEIMNLQGQVDMESYGQAKVFFLSKRVPINELMDLSAESVILLDENKKIIRANTNFLNLLNLNEEKIKNKDFNSVIKKFGINIDENIEEAMKGNEINEEVSIKKPDSIRWYNTKIIPTVYLEGSPGLIIIFSDITDYKLSLEELRKSEKKLRTLIRELDLFLKSVENYEQINADIRNPLQTIVGITDLEGGENSNLIYDQAKKIDESLREINIGLREAEKIREFIKKHIKMDEYS